MRSLTLGLLGPLELAVDGEPVELGGPRQRIVLAMLALNANRVTSIQQLTDSVWGNDPPPTARSQIHISISALRKVFNNAGQPDAIETRSPGYVLHIAEENLDSARFTELVTQARRHIDAGRRDEAVVTLRAAIGLWRGPALVDVASELVRRRAALLEDRRLAAVEERLRVELALGRHREITGELRALVDEHPLREEPYALFMLALYRSGRQAEALEVGRRARAMLIREVGIEPGSELVNLERAILRRDPKLDVFRRGTVAVNERAEPEPKPDPLPMQLPASTGDFVGRESQIADITGLLTENSTGAPYAVRIVAISGKGGVGKTALAVRVAHELGRSFPDGHLYADLEQDDAAEVLTRFLHALGVSGCALPENPQERGELYRSRVANKRLLIVLDSVTSERQVSRMLPGSPTCAVITTSRTRLSGLPGVHRIELDVFNSDESRALLGRIISTDRLRAEEPAARELVRLCGGLPLALRIAGARLASRPHWPIRDLVERLRDETRRLDEFTHRGLAMRSNISLAHRALDGRAQRLFRLLGLIATVEFPHWTAAALLDTGLAEAEDLLACLVDAQLLDVVAHPGARPRYRFHDLIRVYARERLAEAESEPDRLAALGRLLGGWLGMAEQAHRLEYGGDYAILHGCAPRWRPSEKCAIGSPIDWLERERCGLVAAIGQAADAGMDELCWDLALTSVTLFEVKGYFDDWRATAELALRAARQAGNRPGQAAMLYSLGVLNVAQRQFDDAERCFAEALRMFGPESGAHGRALVLHDWAVVDRLRRRREPMLEKLTEALATLRALGDRIGEAQVLCGLATFRIDEGETEPAEVLLDSALAICLETRCLRVEARVHHRYGELYLATDRIEPARRCLCRALLIMRDLGDRIGEVNALRGLGVVQLRAGDLAGAETTLRQAITLAERVGERVVAGQARYTLAEVALARGDDAAADEWSSAAGRIFEELGAALPAAAPIAHE